MSLVPGLKDKIKDKIKKEIVSWIEKEIYPVFAEEIVKHRPEDFLKAAHERWNDNVDIFEEFKRFAPEFVSQLQGAIQFLKKYKRYLPEPKPEHVEKVVDKIAVNLIASGLLFDEKCYIYLTKCIISLFDYIYSGEEEKGQEATGKPTPPDSPEGAAEVIVVRPMSKPSGEVVESHQNKLCQRK